jgi:hypothetical protein
MTRIHIAAAERFEIAEAVLYQDIEQEIVLLNMQNQRYYGLYDIGAEMWRLLLECGDIESAARKMETRYDVDGKKVRADIRSFANDLVEAGLLIGSTVESTADTAESTIEKVDAGRLTIESRRVYRPPAFTDLGPVHALVACAPTPGPDGCIPDCSHS